MGANAVGFGASAVDMAGFSGGGSNPRLKALEQKLQQLTQEKKKAEEIKDEDNVRSLEQQIQNVKRQIEQLKKKEEKKDKRPKEPGIPAGSLSDPPVGACVDVTA